MPSSRGDDACVARTRRDGPGGATRAPLLHAVGVALAVAFAGIAGCAGKTPPPAEPPAAGPEQTAAPELAATHAPAEATDLGRELKAIFRVPRLNALWGVLVQSFDTGEVLYAQNADLLMVPASNMKIITMAVAAEHLGWDHRFETRLEAHGTLTDGTLHGNLVVIGGGDPTFGGPLEEAEPVFEAWASALQAAGITQVTDCLIGDASAFRADPFGAGWSWGGLTYGYSAAVSALSFHENVVEITVQPGPGEGQPAIVELAPGSGGLTLVDTVVTAPGTSEPAIELRRDPGESVLIVHGSVPEDAAPITRTVAVPQPSAFFVSELDRALSAKGITVAGGPVAGESLARAAARGEDAPCIPAEDDTPKTIIASHESKPLREVSERFMKVSQNLYGELLVRAIGATRAAEAPEADTVALGREVIDAQLAQWGVPPDQVHVADGSGLSRLNFVTPRALVRILRRMWLAPEDREPFFDTFPVAGQDGTLRSRFQGTRAAGATHAKTGTLTSVRALSGYVTTDEGETLGFSIIANNFLVPTASIDTVAELAVERLAHFQRTK